MANLYDKYTDLSEDEIWDHVNEIGVIKLQELIRTVVDLIHSHDIGIIIGAGDSGMALARVVEMIYEELSIAPPAVILLPIYRSHPLTEEPIDHSNLVYQVRSTIRDTFPAGDILFIDDEIAKGSTLSKSIEIITSAFPENNAKVIAVAEDHGFDSSVLDNVAFQAYSKEIDGLTNTISYGVPQRFTSRMREHFPESELNSKALFNTLLGQPVKDLEENTPVLSHKWNELAAKEISDFDVLKSEFEVHIRGLIKETLHPH